MNAYITRYAKIQLIFRRGTTQLWFLTDLNITCVQWLKHLKGFSFNSFSLKTIHLRLLILINFQMQTSSCFGKSKKIKLNSFRRIRTDVFLSLKNNWTTSTRIVFNWKLLIQLIYPSFIAACLKIPINECNYNNTNARTIAFLRFANALYENISNRYHIPLPPHTTRTNLPLWFYCQDYVLQTPMVQLQEFPVAVWTVTNDGRGHSAADSLRRQVCICQICRLGNLNKRRKIKQLNASK